MLTMGLGGGFVTSWLGDPGAVTEYNVRFTSPVYVGSDEAADVVRTHAEGLIAHVRAEDAEVPILLHGEERSAWPTLALAAELGLDARIGLEDTLVLPDDRTAFDNAALVRAAMGVVSGS